MRPPVRKENPDSLKAVPAPPGSRGRPGPRLLILREKYHKTGGRGVLLGSVCPAAFRDRASQGLDVLLDLTGLSPKAFTLFLLALGRYPD